MAAKEHEKFQNQYWAKVIPAEYIHWLPAGRNCILPIRSGLPLSETYPENDFLLAPSIFEGNWSFCNRIVQQLTPSPLKLCIFVSVWASLITVTIGPYHSDGDRTLRSINHLQPGNPWLSGRRQKEEKTFNMEKKTLKQRIKETPAWNRLCIVSSASR